MSKKINSFEDLNLSNNLLRGIYAYGWDEPSYIQSVGITPVLEGKDSIIQAQSGTGKTGTFTISVLHKIDTKINTCQAIILSPTREIANQTNNVINKISSFMPDIKITGVIGGKKLNNNDVRTAQVIIGTPGRVGDMIRRNNVCMKTVKMFILDEADQMLNIGFKDQIIDILEYVPKESQIAIYSATMPNSILDITDKFMNNPTKILVQKNELTLDGIAQFYIACDTEKDKFDILCDLYHTLILSQSMVYCATKRKVEWLTQQLEESGFPISKIHSDMTQDTRDAIMTSFRKGQTRILITTDLLARGIDVQGVCLVINYDLPNNKQNYIHRIGRTGRHGRKGIAINFALTNQDYRKLNELEKFYGTEIVEMPENIQKYIS